MDVSVVLTTYNGKRYIEELLDSLRTQSKQIDELLVCDDGSTDGTPEIVRKYILKYSLPWTVQVNEANKGWKKNFRDGILQVTGNYVFPCDQDDIWEQKKIEKMITVLESEPEILLLSSDYAPLYEIGGKIVEEFESTSSKLEKVVFDSHYASGNRPGCVMAIKRDLLEKIKVIWQDWYPHDAFLWTCATFCEGCYILHEPLIRYRRHATNTTNHVTRDKNAVVLSLKRNLFLVKWMLQQSDQITEEKEVILYRFNEYIKLRLALIENGNIASFFRLFKYREFYRSLKQELGDLYLMIQKNE